MKHTGHLKANKRNDFEPVKHYFGNKFSHGFMVWLDKETFSDFIKQAYSNDVAPNTLVRKWILEGLQQ